MTTTIINTVVTTPVSFGTYDTIIVTSQGGVTAAGIAIFDTGTLINGGGVSGSSVGVNVNSGWSVTNQSSGQIMSGVAANQEGVLLASGATLSNAGTIGGTAGVVMTGGRVTNLGGGLIEGTAVGISGSGTVTNGGTILGEGGDAVSFLTSASNLMVVVSGAQFSGTVKGGGVGSTLEFASAASVGMLNGLGFHYVNFAQISVDAGASWSAAGINSIAAGQMLVDDGNLDSTGEFTNAGTVEVGPANLVQLGGTFVNDATVVAENGNSIGVLLGGQVTNAHGATISGGSGIGVVVGGGGTLVNAGLIGGGHLGGAYATSGAMVSNLAGGTISGRTYGFFGAGGTLINAGTIAASAATGIAVHITSADNSRVVVDPGAVFVGTVAGGGASSTLEFATGASNGAFSGLGSQYANFAQVSVDAGAVWTASGSGSLAVGQTLADAGYLSATGEFTNAGAVAVTSLVGMEESGGTFTNNASVTASGVAGILAQDHGLVTNAAGAAITGGSDESVLVDAGATLVNAGLISGGKYGGANVEAGGVVTNLAGGTIAGTNYGLSGYGLTLINAGTIAAGGFAGDAVRFLSATNSRLVVDPGAVFFGTVDGFNTIGSTATSVLEFASGASGGAFSGLGSHYLNFAQILVDTGAQWMATGVNTIAAGETLLDSGKLTFAAGPVGGGSLAFAGSGITLAVGGGAIGPSIGGMAGNTVEMIGTVEHFAGLNGRSLTLSGGTNLTLAGSYTAGQVSVTNDGANTFVTACFADGTTIATTRGAVAVEALGVGERVVTASGRLARVGWIGFRRVDLGRHARPFEVMPVRVRAGALGEGVPVRDLVLSPDHAIWVDGYLVPVRYLINGRSIVQERRDSITYWHVELDRHDLVLAEGVACESYLDTGNRGAFENGADAMTLHPEFGREHALAVWQAEACAPILFDLADLALRARHLRLLVRAERLARAA